MSNIFKIISPEKGLVLPKNNGKITIAQSNNIFAYIDDDFVNWGLDKKSKSVPKSKLAVGEMIANADFKKMFYSLLKKREIESLKTLCLTQNQLVDSVNIYRNWLRADGFATFCLLSKKVAKSEDDFFVARVYVNPVGKLSVNVDKFDDGYVWNAGRRHRVFLPQTADPQVP